MVSQDQVAGLVIAHQLLTEKNKEIMFEFSRTRSEKRQSELSIQSKLIFELSTQIFDKLSDALNIDKEEGKDA